MHLGKDLSYNEKTSLLAFISNGKDYQIHCPEISQAVLSHNLQYVFVITKQIEQEELVVFSFKGDELFRSRPPMSFDFWYLSSTQLRVACQGKNEETADTHGRNAFWFKIDLEQKTLIEDGLAY